MSVLIAGKARTKRLSQNLSQQTLSIKSGVSYGVLKKFERTGQISLQSLLKLAIVLDSLHDFKQVFNLDEHKNLLSLDQMLKEGTRKRGRQ